MSDDGEVKKRYCRTALKSCSWNAIWE